jgi:hypothetical protein
LSRFSGQGGANASEDRTEEDLEENTENPPSEDDEQVKVASSTEIRELYTITPSASFANSSDDDDDECTENSPLVTNEQTSFESTSSAEVSKPFSLKKTSWEHRPLLSRQPEVDQASQSSKDTIVNSIDQEESTEKGAEEFPRPKAPTNLAVSENRDELESQRVTPILFTLSPTRKGARQVVSVVATREIPPAFSRPQSMPSSPRQSKSPRSPKSPTSFRGIFGCRSSSEKDIGRYVSDSSPTSNGRISVSNTAIEEGANDTVRKENTFNGTSGSVSSRNEDITNGDVEIKGEENADDHHALFDGACKGHSKDAHVYAEHQNKVCETKSSLAEDALIMFHSEPLPARVPNLSHQALQQDSLSEKGSNTNDSFEESTNNSDKGYESIDNSPCVESEEGMCRSSKKISKLAQNGISETLPVNELDDVNGIANEPPEPKSSVWVPLMDSGPSAGRQKATAITTSQPDCNLFSQTAV